MGQMKGVERRIVIDLVVLGVAPVYASYKGMLTMRQHTVCSNAIGTKRYIRFLSHPIGADSAYYAVAESGQQSTRE